MKFNGFTKYICYILFFILFNVNYSNAGNYNLIGDPDYYLEINKNKYLTNNTFEKVAKEINNQYKGELEIQNTRPDFELYEYAYLFRIGYQFNDLNNTTMSDGTTQEELEFKRRYPLNIAFGIYWSNNFKMELEFSQNYDRLRKNNFNIGKLNFNIVMFNVYWDYYRYKAKFLPYVLVGIGGIEAKKSVTIKTTSTPPSTTTNPNPPPVITSTTTKTNKIVPGYQFGGGIDYKFQENFSIYLEYKQIKSFGEIFDKFKYDSNVFEVGVRMFYQ